MSKPSIFSKDYKKNMRIRRKKIAILILAILVLALTFIVYSKGNLSGIISRLNLQRNTKQFKSSEVKPQTKNTEDLSIKQKSYEIVLSSDRKINAVYDINENSKKFKCIEPVSSEIIYSINISGNKMIVFDSNKQSILLVDIDGNISDITRKEYTSTDGTFSIKKEIKLQQDAQYIWCSSPIFVDEENIAYISQLPWFGKTEKYVWMYNVTGKTHLTMKDPNGNDLSGNNIKFNSLNNQGLSITVDDKNYILSSKGSVNQ